jgi:hypothetical protein
MRHARDFDPEQGKIWLAAANVGWQLGYHDGALLDRVRHFGYAIWLQSDTALSEDTEYLLRRFVRWMEPSGVRFNIDDGTPPAEGDAV